MAAPKFPLFIDLEGKTVLLVGGGKIAARRARVLCGYGASIKVVAKEICSEIRQLPVAILQRAYIHEDIESAVLVLAATNDTELNHQITQQARSCGIPANNASDRNDCDFYFPAVVQTQQFSVGICGTGRDHHAVAQAAAAIRKLMEEEA